MIQVFAVIQAFGFSSGPNSSSSGAGTRTGWRQCPGAVLAAAARRSSSAPSAGPGSPRPVSPPRRRCRSAPVCGSRQACDNAGRSAGRPGPRCENGWYRCRCRRCRGGDHRFRRRFEHRPAATIAQRQADQRRAFVCPDKLLHLIDGGALFEHLAAEKEPRNTAEVEFVAPSRVRKTWWTARASPASFMPEMYRKCRGSRLRRRHAFPWGGGP